VVVFCTFHEAQELLNKNHQKSTTMKNSFLLFFVFYFFLSPIITTGQPDWTRLLQIGSNSIQDVNAISSDSENIFMAASITGQMTFDGSIYSSIGIRDILLAKLSNSGAILWKKQISPEAYGTLYANVIKTDVTGNIYIAGTFFGTAIIGGNIINSSPLSNAFLAKFDSNGNAVWATPFLSSGSGSSRIAIDNNSDIFLISKTSKLMKFSSLGTLLWEQSYPDRTLHAISVSGSNLYLGGALQKSTDFGSINLPSVGVYNTGFIVKADLNGVYSNSFRVEGSNTFDGSTVSDMVIDPSGNIVIAGGYNKDLILGSITIQNQSRSFYTYIAKCDADFNFIWAKSSGELTDKYRSIWTYRLFQDNSKNIYELGMNSCSFTFGNVNITNTTGHQFLLKFDENGNALSGYPLQNAAQNKAIISPSGKLQLGSSYNYTGSPSFGNFFLKQFQTDMTLEWETTTTNSMPSGSVRIKRIKHDQSGNTFVQARVLGNFDYMGTQVVTNDEITLISKIDINGNLVWTTKINDIRPDDFGSTFILDKDNNVLTIGAFQSSIKIGSTTLTSTNAGYEGYVAKYNTNGDFVWASKFDFGNDISKNMNVASDQDGNVIVSGVIDPANYIVKFDANGNRLWSKLFPMESRYLSLISVDGNNNIYLTSEIHLSDNTGTTSIGSVQLTQTKSDGSTALIKFDPFGNTVWAKTFGEVPGAEYSDGWPCNIKTDLDGNSYIWGWCPNNATFGSSVLTNPNSTNQGYSLYLAKINTSGDVIWAKAVFETKNGYNYGDLLDLDSKGNVYIGGHFKDLIQIDGFQFRPVGTNDFFMAKLSDSGDFQWIKTIPANSEIVKALNVQSNDVASVCGYAGIDAQLGSFPIYRKSGSNCMIATLGNLSTDMKEITNPLIEVYPNPANTTLFMKNLNEVAVVSIYDINGKMVIHHQISNQQVDIGNLPTGFYTIKIKNAKINTQQKFLKQ